MYFLNFEFKGLYEMKHISHSEFVIFRNKMKIYNIQHRHEVNLLIYEILMNHSPFMKEEFMSEHMFKLICKYPQQRFGQLLCNYVFPDYSYTDNEIMKIIFGEYDPFYEESIDTYLKVCKLYNQKPKFEKDNSTNYINDLILK